MSLALLTVVLVFLMVPGLRMAQAKAPDFEFFYKAGRWLLDHGGPDRGVDLRPDGRVVPRGTIEWYLPFVARLMTLLAWLPQPTAGVIWLGINLAALLAVSRLIALYFMEAPRGAWPAYALAPLLLLILPWYWEIRLNQINALTLLLSVAGFVHWRQGRPVLSGVWLGLAILIKLTPALLLVWFALKRQGRTLGAAVMTVALAGPVADVITFGPQQAADVYRAWWRAAIIEGSARGNIMAQREMDWRNQATPAVLSRWLCATNWSTRFDNDPRLSPDPTPRYINVTDWPAARVAGLVFALSAALMGGLAVLARRPAGELPAWRLKAEWALFLLATLWLMPVMRRYHMVWAMPAAAILLSHVWRAQWGGSSARLALGGLVMFLLTQVSLSLNALLGTNILEAAGVLWLGTVALGTALWVLVAFERRAALASALSSTLASPAIAADGGLPILSRPGDPEATTP